MPQTLSRTFLPGTQQGIVVYCFQNSYILLSVYSPADLNTWIDTFASF